MQRATNAPRVMAIGTVLATGGAAAPLIDAAWREQAAILDACLSAAPELAAGRAPVRLAVELAIDRRGRITAVAIKLPPAVGAWGSANELSLCLEQAIKTRLRLPPPQPRVDARAHGAVDRLPLARSKLREVSGPPAMSVGRWSRPALDALLAAEV